MVTIAFSLGGKRRPFTVSPNYAVGLPNGAAVTDARGTAWRTTGGNQVSVNGVTDTTTSGVARIILVTGQIWQTAASGWFFKTFPSDAWTFSAAGLTSASMATINLGDVTSAIIDARAFVWMLTAGGVIIVDGVADAVTHDVTQLVYFNSQIWQNTIFGWYHKTLPTDAWVSSAAGPGAGSSGTRAPILGADLGDPGGITNGQGPSADYFSQFRSALSESPTMLTTYGEPDRTRVVNGVTVEVDWSDLTEWTGTASWSCFGAENLNGLVGAAPITILLVGVPLAKYQSTRDTHLDEVIAGTWNPRYAALYAEYKRRGFTTVYIRPGWEMNGDWEPWSWPYDQWNSTHAAKFASAFAACADHAHTYAAANGMNIQTVWNPGYLPGGQGPDYNQLYPGDAYVDHVGIDTYGPYSDGSGGSPSNSPLVTVSDNTHFTLTDAINFCILHNKPLCFPETGVSPGETVFQNNIATKMTQNPTCRCSFVAIWDQPGGNGPNSLWSTNANSGAAWKSLMQAVRTNNPW